MACETRTDAAAKRLARAIYRDLEDALDLMQEGVEVLRRVASLDGAAQTAMEHANAAVSTLEAPLKKPEPEAEKKAGVKVMPPIADGDIAEDLPTRADARMSA